jgi:hypothetical protein
LAERSSSARATWHAAVWPVPNTVISGSSVAQRPIATGHRVRNRHPDGGEIGLGISPLSGAATIGRSGSGCGIDCRSARVYG